MYRWVLVILIMFFIASLSIHAAAHRDTHQCCNYKALLVDRGVGIDVFRVNSGYLVIHRNPAIPVPPSDLLLSEPRVFKPSTLWTNSTILILYWSDRNYYIAGQNITVNVLALGPSGPLGDVHVVVGVERCGDWSANATAVTNNDGVARVTLTIPENVSPGYCRVYAESEQSATVVGLQQWLRVNAPLHIVRLRPASFWAKAHSDYNNVSVKLLGIDKLGRLFNGSLELRIYIDTVNQSDTSSYDLVPYAEYDANISFSNGVAEFWLPNVPANSVVKPFFVVNGTEHPLDPGFFLLYRPVFVIIEPLSASVSGTIGFVDTSVLNIPLMAVYSNFTVFSGTVRAWVEYHYVNGSARVVYRTIEFNNGIGILSLNVSQVSFVYMRIGAPWSVARDRNGVGYIASGSYLFYYRVSSTTQPPSQPSKAEKRLSITLYMDDPEYSWQENRPPNIYARVTYGDEPVANATVYFYLPWKDSETYSNKTSNEGIAVLSGWEILRYINTSTVLGRERAAFFSSIPLVATVTLGGESAATTLYFRILPDLFGWPSVAANLSEATVGAYNVTICFIDNVYEKYLGNIVFSSYAESARFAFHRYYVAGGDGAPIRPGKCRSFFVFYEDGFGITAFLSGLWWGSHYVLRTLSLPSIYVKRLGLLQENAITCWVFGDPVEYVNKSITVEGKTETMYGEPVPNSSVIMALSYEEADGIAYAKGYSNTSGDFSLELPPAKKPTYIQGSMIAITPNGTVFGCNTGLGVNPVEVYGWIRGPQTQTTTPTTTTTATSTTTPKTMPPQAPPVGGVLYMPKTVIRSNSVKIVKLVIGATIVYALLVLGRPRERGKR